jgi:hypothetical protein
VLDIVRCSANDVILTFRLLVASYLVYFYGRVLFWLIAISAIFAFSEHLFSIQQMLSEDFFAFATNTDTGTAVVHTG